MTKTLSATMKVAISASLENTVDIGSIGYSMPYSKTLTFANGTGANQGNMVFSDTRTLSASGTENLDLAGGLTDAYGAAITFTRIKGIIISASSSNTNNVIVGGDATSTFFTMFGAETDSVVVRPGGFLALGAPDATSYAVTASTGDLLMITNSAGTTGVTYDIVIIGTI